MDANGIAGLSQAQLANQAQKPKKQEGPWQGFEDDALRRAIHQNHGASALERTHDMRGGPTTTFKWSEISDACYSTGCRRDAKQCRERWVNHLDPNIDNNGQLTQKEADTLMGHIRIHGKRWAMIGRMMKKSENQLKNYFYQQDKKQKNQRKHIAPRRESHTAQPQQYTQQYTLPQLPSSRVLPHPRTSYSSDTTGFDSRRTSIASTNPGMMSDAGSPAESSPPSPFGSLPYDPHSPAWSASKNGSPQLQFSTTMGRTQSDPNHLLSPSSPYSHYSDSRPMSRHYSAAPIYTWAHDHKQSLHHSSSYEYPREQEYQQPTYYTPPKEQTDPTHWGSVNYHNDRMDSAAREQTYSYDSRAHQDFQDRDTPRHYQTYNAQSSHEEVYPSRPAVPTNTQPPRLDYQPREANSSHDQPHEANISHVNEQSQVPEKLPAVPRNNVMSIKNLCS